MAAVSAGDTNIKVANTVGFAEGALVAIDTGNGTDVRTVARGGVGTAGRNLALVAPAAAGDTNIKVTNVFGFEVGMPVIVDAGGSNPETRVIAGPVDSNGRFTGTGGITGTGVTFSAPLSVAHTQSALFRNLGSGITLASPLTRSHADGAVVRSLGSGITLSAPLRNGHVIDAKVADSGTGVEVTPVIRSAWPSGTLASNEAGVGVAVFANGGSATLKSLDIWQMDSAW